MSTSAQEPYDVFQQTPEGTIISPIGLFLAGAARAPSKRPKRPGEHVQGRRAWSWYHATGCLFTAHSSGWILDKGRSRSRLIWFEGGACNVVLKQASIQNWLKAEHGTLWGYAERRIKVSGALVQVELALELL